MPPVRRLLPYLGLLLLCSCGGGSVPAPGSSTTSAGLQAVTVPQFAAVTVPVSNPAAGQPLVVSATVLGGTASMTFPAGTTVTPGTQIVMQTVQLPPLVFTQSRARSPESDTTPSPSTPGLSVQVVNGQIEVNNGSGSQLFSAGQFGFVPGFPQPPVVVPTGPGQAFQPPPTFAAPVDAAGNVGAAYPVTTTANGNVQAPIVLGGSKATTLVLGPQSMFPLTTTFVDPSTASVTPGASSTTLTMPAIDGGFTASAVLPPAVNAASASINASYSLNAPAGAAAISSSTRVRASVGGTFATISYLTLTPAGAVSFTATPAFTFGFPTGFSVPAGQSLYVAFYDPTHPSNGWTTLAGPGAVSGQNVTFASVSLPTALAASAAYQFALISTAQTLTVPTPAPTATPIVATQNTPASTGGEQNFALPSTLTGLAPGGNIFYAQTVTTATQNVTVSASTGNFAGLTVPANQTAALYLTVGFASGTNLTFDSSSLPMQVAGPLFAAGTTYTMTATLQGSALTSNTAVAQADLSPTDAGGGFVEFTSPLTGFTLHAGQQVGIVISR